MSAPSTAAGPASVLRIPVFPARGGASRTLSHHNHILPQRRPRCCRWENQGEVQDHRELKSMVGRQARAAGQTVAHRASGRHTRKLVRSHGADEPPQVRRALHTHHLRGPERHGLQACDRVYYQQGLGSGPRLTLCADAASHRLALILSMHHHAADGHTYYRILNMLSDKEGEVPIEALNPVRDEGFPAWMADRFPGEQWAGIRIIMLSKLLGSLVSRPMQVRVHFVDADKIASAKAKSLWEVKQTGAEVTEAEKEVTQGKGAEGKEIEGTGVTFVSTNDVLASCFASLLSLRILIMIINLRKLFDSAAGDSLVGNYWSLLLYNKQIFSKPAAICASLQFEDDSKTHSKLPSSRSNVCKRFAALTSWAGFSRELRKICAQEQLHLPVGFTLRWHKGPPTVPIEIAVVFRARGSELGLLTFTRGLTTQQYDQALPVGGVIMQAYMVLS
ncbi:hypothetical protein B484DRAFT_431081 [Ochromonadaceae sp. CCMP2298]|nr:hypothetical protein B484DRAFT_431081 [Ochromonadaceae sp. CCMP2298]